MDITTFCTQLINNTILSEDERKEHDQFFAALSIEDQVVLFELIDTAFRNLTPADDWSLRLDYLRWYTLLMWRRLRSATRVQVSEIAFPRQLMMALLLDYDPIVELMNYIDGNPFDKESAATFYQTLQEKTLASNAVIGIQKNQPVTLSQIAQRIVLLNQQDDSLKRTEFFAELQEILYTKNDASAYSSADPEEATSRLIDTVQFLLGVKPDKIYSTVRVSLHADEYEQILAFNERGTATVATSETKEEPVPAPETPDPEILEALQPVSTRPTYTELKNIIEEDVLKLGLTDPIARAEAVAERLTNLAEYYKDEKIRELYYYNEEDGKFYWNEDLLKS